jgi:hypothetical protein
MEFPTIFGIAHDDFLRDEISTKRTIAKNELAPLYYPGNENFYGKTHDLLPEYAIINNIFRNTLTPKRGDRTSIRGSTRNLLLALLDNMPPPCISTFLWMEFGYDGKHGAYQPHVIRGPVDPPPPHVIVAGTLAVAPASHRAHAPCSPPAVSRHAPSAAPESSCATTRHGKKHNILIKGLKTLIFICHSNDALIRESH